jgi:hypothetical protein
VFLLFISSFTPNGFGFSLAATVPTGRFDSRSASVPRIVRPTGSVLSTNPTFVESTPHFQNGTWSRKYALPATPPNHWWLIDYWNAWNYYGSFTAVANSMTGLSSGDDVLILPLNLAYGSSTNLEWFQFDIDFNGGGNGWPNNIWWGIWNVDAPSGCSVSIPDSNYHPHTTGLTYTIGHAYHYQGSIVGGNFRFQIWDDSAGTNWYMDFSVPSTSQVYDTSCFSPASAVEGYTTPSSVSNVPYYEFIVGYGMTSFSFSSYGSGVPTGISTNQWSLGGSPTTWHWEMTGTLRTVTFKTNPSSWAGTAGSITVDGSSTYTNGQTGSYTGTHNILVNVPSGYQFVWVRGNRNPPESNPTGVYVPNISVNPTTMMVDGNGYLKAVYCAIITFHTSTGTGSISYGSQSYTDGQTLCEGQLPPDYGNTVTIAANPPDSNHPFVSWSTSGGLSVDSSSSPTTTLHVNGPGTLTANFQTGYMVTFNTNPTSFVSSAGTITFSGSTYSNGQTGSYSSGDYSATANVPTDYQFLRWEYSGSSGSGVYVPNIAINPTTVQVRGTGWLKAVYTAKVTFYTNPSSQGSISWGSCSNPGKTNGQTIYDGSLPPEFSNSITVCVNTPSGYAFSGWSCSGGLSCSGSNPSTTVTFTGPGSITATFTQVTVTVTVYSVALQFKGQDPSTVTDLHGSVYNSYQNSASTTTYNFQVPVNTQVTFSVSSSPSGWSFANWWDDYGFAQSNSQSLTINVGTANHKIAAFFTYSITFSQSGIPIGTTWGVTAGGTYYTTTSSSLTASGLSGTVSYSYDSRVAGASGVRYVCSSGCLGSVSGPTTVTANYNTQYYLTVNSAYDSPNPTSNWFDAGTPITASVTSPVSGGTGTQYVCTGWSGSGSVPSSGSSCSVSFNINAPSSITWNWKTQYYLTVKSAYDSPNPSSGWFDTGTSITASVTSPVSGGTGIRYLCTGWTGAGSVPPSGSGCSVSFGINAPSSVTWNWQTQYYLTMQANPSGGGSFTPSSGWQNSGANVTMQATANPNYLFSSWSGSGSGSYSGTSNPARITMVGLIAETANFQSMGQALSVVLLSPSNGGVVLRSPLTFKVQVLSNGRPVQGATVTIYLNRAPVCTGSSDSNGYYSCSYALAQTGHPYTWYTTATKPGYTLATSQTYTFTYRTR